MKFKNGDRIKFRKEKQRYTVRACNDRYVICVKKNNLPNISYLYTIIDLKKNIRGAHNLIFNCYKDTDRNWRLMLLQLTRGTIGISHRNYIELDIENIKL